MSQKKFPQKVERIHLLISRRSRMRLVSKVKFKDQKSECSPNVLFQESNFTFTLTLLPLCRFCMLEKLWLLLMQPSSENNLTFIRIRIINDMFKMGFLVFVLQLLSFSGLQINPSLTEILRFLTQVDDLQEFKLNLLKYIFDMQLLFLY